MILVGGTMFHRPCLPSTPFTAAAPEQLTLASLEMTIHQAIQTVPDRPLAHLLLAHIALGLVTTTFRPPTATWLPGLISTSRTLVAVLGSFIAAATATVRFTAAPADRFTAAAAQAVWAITSIVAVQVLGRSQSSIMVMWLMVEPLGLDPPSSLKVTSLIL